MCTSQLPVSEFSVVNWLSRIMETETGTINKMENMKIWVVLPQTPTKWGWAGYWWFIQIDSDIFSMCQREIVLSSIGYQKCLRSIKNTNICSKLIKMMTFFPKDFLNQIVNQHISFKIMTKLFLLKIIQVFSAHPFFLISSLNQMSSLLVIFIWTRKYFLLLNYVLLHSAPKLRSHF